MLLLSLLLLGNWKEGRYCGMLLLEKYPPRHMRCVCGMTVLIKMRCWPLWVRLGQLLRVPRWPTMMSLPWDTRLLLLLRLLLARGQPKPL